jgi:hypothetical protein
MRVYGGSDYAVTADGGDFTVHVVVGIDPENGCICSTSGASRRRPMNGLRRFAIWLSSGSRSAGRKSKARSSLASARFLINASAIESLCLREQFPTRGDKAMRAQSIRGRMAQEGLYVPTRPNGTPISLRATAELPAGKHDDQVDALGLVGQLLAHECGSEAGRA